jgi:hypothetical protein
MVSQRVWTYLAYFVLCAAMIDLLISNTLSYSHNATNTCDTAIIAIARNLNSFT